MANEKILQTRIITKHADYAALSTSEYVLKEGEIILGKVNLTETDASGRVNTTPAFLAKVGNGGAAKDAPWMYAKAVDVYGWAKKASLDLADIPAITLDSTAASLIKKHIDDADAALDGRISALEAKFTGDGSVEALIAAALQSAKDYADEKDAALKTELQGYADGKANDAKAAAEATAKGYNDALDARLTPAEASIATLTGTGDGSVAKALADAKAYAESEADAAESAAKSYADGLAGNYDAAGSADDALEAAKGYADDLKEAIDGQISSINGTLTDLGNNKLDKSEFETFKGTNTTAIGTAKSEAIAAAAQDATSKANAAETAAKGHADSLNTAMDGRMTTAEGKITTAEGKIADIEGRLANVSNVMDFRGAVEVLPASTEGYQDGDVIVVTGTGDEEADKNNTNIGKEFVVSDGKFIEFGNTDANTSAITALQGRMGTAESDIDALEGNIATINAAIGTDGLAGDIAALEGEVSGLKTTVGDANGGLVKGVADNATAIAAEAAKRAEEDGKLSTAISDEETRATGIEAGLRSDITNIQAAIGTDGLDGRISALEETVGDADDGLVKDVATNAKAIAEEATARGEADNALTKAINDEAARAQGVEGTLGGRIDGIVSDITGENGINAKIAANAEAISDNAEAIAANTEAIGDSTKGLTKALADETQARSDADTALGGRIDDIALNYLKVSTTGEGTSAVHTIVDQDANVIIFDCGGLE